MKAKTIICKECLDILHPMRYNTCLINGFLACIKCKDPNNIEIVDNFIVNDFFEEFGE